MLKTSIRRILAFVCAISLMATSCFVLAPQLVAEAEGEAPANSSRDLQSMKQEGWNVVTPQTFGVPDTTGAAVDADINENISLNKLLFAANVMRADDGTTTKTNLFYLQGPGGQNIFQLQMIPGDNRIYFYNQIDYSDKNVMYRGDSEAGTTKAYGSSGSSNYFSLKPSEFGLTSFKGDELKIWITTEFVRAPWLTEGEADDLKIGIWVNGELYTYNGVDTYFYVLDCKENTYKGELRTSNEKLAISSPSVGTPGSTPIDFIDVESKISEGYRVVTPLTFGVPDTTDAAVDANKNETISLDKLLFAANMTRADDGTTTKTNLFYLQGPGGQNIFQLQMIPGDNRIYFYNQIDYSDKNVMYRGDSEAGTTKAYGSSGTGNYFSLKPSEFGLTTFKGTDLQIWITTEFVRAPWLTEGEADDLKIGLWINGQLYTYNGVDTYFYVLDCKENTYKGELRTSNEKIAISSTFIEPNDMGMVGGEYASETGEFKTSDLVANKVLDGITFHSSVRFEGEGGTLYYGSQNEGDAIKFTSTAEGILVTHGEEEIGLINQDNVGVDVLNHNFNLKLETEFVDCDADELTDDVKLGIYVNNKYSSVDLVDAADALTATIGIKTTGDATVLVGDFASEAPEQVSWDLSNGAYTIEKTDSVSRISVDGVSKDGDLVLDTAGTYSVTVTENGKVYMKDFIVSGDSTEPPVNPPGDEEPPLEPTLPTDFIDVESKIPEGHRVVTPLTFGVPDTKDAAVTATKIENISLDKLLFSANVTREDDGTTTKTNLFYLQGPGGQNIFQLQMIPGDNRIYFYNQIDYSDKNVMYRGDSEAGTTKAYGSSGTGNYFSLKPSEFGLTTFKGTDLRIWITTEFVRAPWLAEGEADDLKIGLWINDQLYTYDGVETYFYVLDCKENTYSGDLRTNNEKLAISSTFIEPNDMGMVGGEYASAEGEFYTSDLVANKVLDGITFHSSVRFEGEGGTLYYGSSEDANAIKLTSTTEGILVTHGEEEIGLINQNNVGIDVLNNKFDLKLETEFVDCDADELTDDVKLGIYVNNKYKSFDLVDAVATLTATIGVKTTGDATVLVGEPIDPPVNPPGGEEPPLEPEGETLPTDFTKITPVDFGIYNGTYTNQETGALTPVSSMDRVLFETDVTYGTSSGSIRYMKQQGKTIDNSVRINSSTDGTIRVFNYISSGYKLYVDGAAKDYLTISPSKAISGATTFSELTFTLSITTEYVDYDNDGQTNDIKMGIWFNGKLYNEQYIYLKNCASDCEASLVVSKVTINTLNGEAPVIAEPTLPEITFSDFDISDGTYGYNNKSLAVSGKYSEGVANKSFVGTFNFSDKKGSTINIGGVKSGWEGVKLVIMGEDKLYFSEASSRFAAVMINQKDVAVALKENDVRFKLSIEVVDLDNDGIEDDVRFWLYFEDVLYQGRPIVQAIDYAQYLGNYLGIYSSNNASSVTIKSANLNRPKVEVDFSIMGFTKDWKKTLMSTKGASSGVNSSTNRSPYTGEQSTVGIYFMASVLSLTALAYVLYKKRNQMSE